MKTSFFLYSSLILFIIIFSGFVLVNNDNSWAATLPSAPSNLTLNVVSQTQVDLSWEHTSSGELGFKILRKEKTYFLEGGIWEYDESKVIATVGPSEHYFEDKTVRPDNKYFYAVFAYNSSGNVTSYTASGDKMLACTPRYPPGTLTLDTPSPIYGGVTHSTVELHVVFDAVKMYAWPDFFDAYYRKSGDSQFIKVTPRPFNNMGYSTNDRILYVTNLKSQTKYDFMVSATNSGGETLSNIIIVTTKVAPLPLAIPYNLQAMVITDRNVKIVWSHDPEDLCSEGFTIERSTDGGVNYTKIGTSGRYTLEFNDETVRPNTNYMYRVYAHNYDGLFLDYSQPLSVRTADGEPPAPTELAVLSCTPNAGSGYYKDYVTFTTTFSGNGTNDIKLCNFFIGAGNPSTSPFLKYRAFVSYNNETNKLLVQDISTGHSGNFYGEPGSQTIIYNSYISVDCSRTTITRNGANVTIEWRIKLLSMGGIQDLNFFVSDAAGNSAGYVKKGTYTIEMSHKPTVDQLAPEQIVTIPGQFTTITAVYNDMDGNTDLGSCVLNVYPFGSRIRYLAAYYDVSKNKIFFQDKNSNWQSADVGADLIIENQGTGKIDCKNTIVTINNNSITVNWRVCLDVDGGQSRLSPVVAQCSDIAGMLSNETDAEWAVGWDPSGGIPAVNISYPSSITSGLREYRNIIVEYTDASSAANLAQCGITAYGGSLMANMIYKVDENKLYNFEINNAVGHIGGIVPGLKTKIDTLAGSIDCEKTTVSISGNKITINWHICINREPDNGNEYTEPFTIVTAGATNKTGGIGVQPYTPIINWVLKCANNTAPTISSFVVDKCGTPIRPGEYINCVASAYDPDDPEDITRYGVRIYSDSRLEEAEIVYDKASNSLILKGRDEPEKYIVLGQSRYLENRNVIVDTAGLTLTENDSVQYPGSKELQMKVKFAFKKPYFGKHNIEPFVADEESENFSEPINITVMHPPVFADIDSDGRDEIAVCSETNGAIICINDDMQARTILHNVPPKSIVKARIESKNYDNLVIDFGAQYGIWMKTSGGWSPIHLSSAECITSGDLDGDGYDELIIDFGNAGVYSYFPMRNESQRWERIHNISPVLIAAGDIDKDGKDECVIDFCSYGIYTFNYGDASPWTQLHKGSSKDMVISDSDMDGYDEIILNFEKYGIWRCTLNPAFPESQKWSQLHSMASRYMVMCDMDGDGRDELVVDFTNIESGDSYGIYTLDGRSGYVDNNINLYWDILHPKGANSLSSGNFDKVSQGKELLVDFGPELKKWISNVRDQQSGIISWSKVE